MGIDKYATETLVKDKNGTYAISYQQMLRNRAIEEREKRERIEKKDLNCKIYRAGVKKSENKKFFTKKKALKNKKRNRR